MVVLLGSVFGWCFKKFRPYFYFLLSILCTPASNVLSELVFVGGITGYIWMGFFKKFKKYFICCWINKHLTTFLKFKRCCGRIFFP